MQFWPGPTIGHINTFRFRKSYVTQIQPCLISCMRRLIHGNGYCRPALVYLQGQPPIVSAIPISQAASQIVQAGIKLPRTALEQMTPKLPKCFPKAPRSKLKGGVISEIRGYQLHCECEHLLECAYGCAAIPPGSLD
jgi:hypothetical protein